MKDPLLAVLRVAKKAGISRQDAERVLIDSTKRAARENSWRDSELAVTLTERMVLLDFVYGKKELSIFPEEQSNDTH